jgi:mRNA interferase MazF
LVIAAGELEATRGLLWLAMITSAANRGWAGDAMISDLPAAGLPIPSIVRTAKLATIEARDAQRLGTLPLADRDTVTRSLRDWLAAALDLV